MTLPSTNIIQQGRIVTEWDTLRVGVEALKRLQVETAAEFERTDLEIMLTGTPAFKELIESRRNRREDWFQVQAGRVDICNVPNF